MLFLCEWLKPLAKVWQKDLKSPMELQKPFNPLDKANLGESVADALLSKAVEQLPPQSFSGAGIYALYYTGNFEHYARIAALNRKGRFAAPIYIGKAVPEGSRKGGILGEYRGKKLWERLNKHAGSIEQAANLDLNDFSCRYLVLEDVWIPLGESLLIEKFKPLWNQVIEGFGINAPGVNRKDQKRSMWDRIHPGRSYAARDDGTGDELVGRVMESTQRHIDEYVESLKK